MSTDLINTGVLCNALWNPSQWGDQSSLWDISLGIRRRTWIFKKINTCVTEPCELEDFPCRWTAALLLYIVFTVTGSMFTASFPSLFKPQRPLHLSRVSLFSLDFWSSRFPLKLSITQGYGVLKSYALFCGCLCWNNLGVPFICNRVSLLSAILKKY